MLHEELGYSNVKPWQQEAISTIVDKKRSIVALSRATGDGKTLVIKGCAMALAGVTLLITPNITLTGFMAEDFQNEYFQVVNIDNIKNKKEKKEFQKKFRPLFHNPNQADMQRLVIVCSPHTLVENSSSSWCSFLFLIISFGLL